MNPTNLTPGTGKNRPTSGDETEAVQVAARATDRPAKPVSESSARLKRRIRKAVNLTW